MKKQNENEIKDFICDYLTTICIDVVGDSIPIMGSFFRVVQTREIKERLTELENALLKSNKELEFIKTKFIIEKYLSDIEKLDEKILKKAIKLCETDQKKEDSIEVLELLSKLSTFELNDIYKLDINWMINFEGNKIWQIQKEESNELYFGMNLKTINKLIEIGILKSFTTGMSYGSSSDNFGNIQVTRIGITFLDYLYDYKINDNIEVFKSRKPMEIEIKNKNNILNITGRYQILLNEFRSLEIEIDNYNAKNIEYKLFDYKKQINEMTKLREQINKNLNEYYKKFDEKFQKENFLDNYDSSKDYKLKS